MLRSSSSGSSGSSSSRISGIRISSRSSSSINRSSSSSRRSRSSGGSSSTSISSNNIRSGNLIAVQSVRKEACSPAWLHALLAWWPFSPFEKRHVCLPGCMQCLCAGRSVGSEKKACMPARYHESIRFVVLVIVVVVVVAIAVAVVVVAIVVVGSM